jgi:hypothetical protein
MFCRNYLYCDIYITAMKTISEDYFIQYFMEISQKLTLAELRMLYMLIKEPDVVKLSQEGFGNKIKAHRRTINLGLKKLKEYQYVEDAHFNVKEITIAIHPIEKSKKTVSEREVSFARDLVITAFKKFYYPIKDDYIFVNEDFYSSILGHHGLHKNLRYDREFITKTLEGTYPQCRFLFKQGKPSNISDLHFDIIRNINHDIIQARSYKRHYIDKDKLIRNMSDRYSINEEDVLGCIKLYFPKLTILMNRIKTPKPWRGKRYLG